MTECETCSIGYKLEGGTCEEIGDSNCSGYNEDNKCLACTGDFYLDTDD